jgi:hypothetical protein
VSLDAVMRDIYGYGFEIIKYGKPEKRTFEYAQ